MPEAIQDREAIYDDVEADNPVAALAHQNCLLIYDLSGDRVRMLRVLRAARQWPPEDRSRGDR